MFSNNWKKKIYKELKELNINTRVTSLTVEIQNCRGKTIGSFMFLNKYMKVYYNGMEIKLKRSEIEEIKYFKRDDNCIDMMIYRAVFPFKEKDLLSISLVKIPQKKE